MVISKQATEALNHPTLIHAVGIEVNLNGTATLVTDGINHLPVGTRCAAASVPTSWSLIAKGYTFLLCQVLSSNIDLVYKVLLSSGFELTLKWSTRAISTRHAVTNGKVTMTLEQYQAAFLTLH